MEKLLTVNEICGILKVTRRTVIRWIQSDQLMALKVGRRLWRIRERDLKNFLKKSSSREKRPIPNLDQAQDHSSVKFW